MTTLDRAMIHRKVSPVGRATVRARLVGLSFADIAATEGRTRQAIQIRERHALALLDVPGSIDEMFPVAAQVRYHEPNEGQRDFAKISPESEAAKRRAIAPLADAELRVKLLEALASRILKECENSGEITAEQRAAYGREIARINSGEYSVLASGRKRVDSGR